MEIEGLSDMKDGVLRQLSGMMETWYSSQKIQLNALKTEKSSLRFKIYLPPVSYVFILQEQTLIILSAKNP